MKEVIIFVFSTIFFFYISITAYSEFESYKCDQYSKITGRLTKYNYFDECYVYGEDGVWYTMDEYKSVLSCR